MRRMQYKRNALPTSASDVELALKRAEPLARKAPCPFGHVKHDTLKLCPDSGHLRAKTE